MGPVYINSWNCMAEIIFICHDKVTIYIFSQLLKISDEY